MPFSKDQSLERHLLAIQEINKDLLTLGGLRRGMNHLNFFAKVENKFYGFFKNDHKLASEVETQWGALEEEIRKIKSEYIDLRETIGDPEDYEGKEMIFFEKLPSHIGQAKESLRELKESFTDRSHLGECIKRDREILAEWDNERIDITFVEPILFNFEKMIDPLLEGTSLNRDPYFLAKKNDIVHKLHLANELQKKVAATYLQKMAEEKLKENIGVDYVTLNWRDFWEEHKNEFIDMQESLLSPSLGDEGMTPGQKLDEIIPSEYRAFDLINIFRHLRYNKKYALNRWEMLKNAWFYARGNSLYEETRLNDLKRSILIQYVYDNFARYEKLIVDYLLAQHLEEKSAKELADHILKDLLCKNVQHLKKERADQLNPQAFINFLRIIEALENNLTTENITHFLQPQVEFAYNRAM